MTPTPQGRLLSVLAEVDLALPAGNAFKPGKGALSSTGDLLYILGTARLEGANYVLAAVDTQAGRLQRVVPLPGYSSGPILVGDGRLYLPYNAQGKTHLLSLASDSFKVIADVTLGSVATPVGMAFDAAAGRLYLALPERLEIRQATDLSILDNIAQGWPGSILQLAFDPLSRRLYVSSSQEVRAYDAAAFALLWKRDTQGKAVELVLDGTGQRLYVKTEDWQADKGPSRALLSLSAATGQLLGKPEESVAPGNWSLVGAKGGRVYLLGSSQEGCYTAMVEAGSTTLAHIGLRSSYFYDALYDPQQERLYLPDSQNHLVRVWDARKLARQHEIPLAVEIRDIIVGEKRLYVSDSAGRLHVLDLDGRQVIAQVQAGRGRQMVLDEAGQRLYVPVEEGGHEIAVVDTAAMAVKAVVTGGDRIAVDNVHGRLFVGYAPPLWSPTKGEVRVLDARTLAPLHVISRAGMPTYNPSRDEIYITDYTVYVYDGRTYKELGELTPDIGAQTLRGCSGCLQARGVYVYPDRDLLLVDVTILAAGAGVGIYPPPRIFSLKSREPLTYPASAFFTCGGELELQQPTEGVLYTTASYARYVFYQNVAARQVGSGEVLRWRDGINAELVVPGSGVIYCGRGREFFQAIDIKSWTPLGHVPYRCLHTLDLARHRLYATDASRLIVLRDSGGQPLPKLPPEPVSKLPATEGSGITLYHPAIEEIVISPNYVEDRTLWVTGGGQLLRSTDGGKSWVRLQGGLSYLKSTPLGYKLTVSPNYRADRTLYVAASGGESVGYGVLRSTDGGDTWEMLWQGLDHLRVTEVVLSPDWARDGMMLAYTRYQQVALKMEGGESLFRSTDRGEHWELVKARTYDAPPLPKPEELLPIQKPLVQIGRRGYEEVARTQDGGRSWKTVLNVPQGQWIVGIATVPTFPEDKTIYVATGSALYRSRNLGDTWESARDARITQLRDWPLRWRALAVAPERGGHRLFLGDEAGNLLIISPDEPIWEAVAVPVPSATPVRTVTPLPPTPLPRTATPTPCTVAAGPAFSAAAGTARSFLGCPVDTQREGFFAAQPFERGRMFWREDTRRIYVLLEGGRWVDLPDTWGEGQPTHDPTLVAPEGRVQPVRGFGKVWREALGGPKAAIGWALQAEVGYRAAWQACERGLLLTDDAGNAYALRDDMSWERVK